MHRIKNTLLLLAFSLTNFLYSVSSQSFEQDCFNNFLQEDAQMPFNPYPEKKVKLKFHFIRNDDPFWGFTEAEANTIVSEVMDTLNYKINNNKGPWGEDTYPIWDINLTFELASIELYDLDLCEGYGAGDFNADPGAVNIFFEEHDVISGPDCAYDEDDPSPGGGSSTFQGLPRSFRIIQPYYRYTLSPYLGGQGDDYTYSVWADIIVHEIGHNVGLNHNFGTSVPNCSDVEVVPNACSTNNFMDGCGGNKSTLTPCQISTFHTNLSNWGEEGTTSFEEMEDPWSLPDPIIDTLQFDEDNGILYMEFNEDDFNAYSIDYCWSMNGTSFTTLPIVTFNWIEYEGQTIDLCLHILDKGTGNLKKVCKEITFPELPTCFHTLNSDVIAHFDEDNYPLSLQLGNVPNENVFWSFESQSGLMNLDNPCAEVPNLVYDQELITYQGDSVNVCVKRYGRSYGQYCKNEVCTTLFFEPQVPLCDDFNREIGFEYYSFSEATFGGVYYENGIRLIGNASPGVLKYTWFNNADNFTPDLNEGKKVVFESADPNNWDSTNVLNFTLIVEDLLNDCIVSRIADRSIHAVCFDFGDLISYDPFTNKVKISAFYNNVINEDSLFVYINDQRYFPEWAEVNDIQASTKFDLPSDCGVFNIFFFQMDPGCIQDHLTVEVGAYPCPVDGEPFPDHSYNLTLSPNPSSTGGTIRVEFENDSDEALQLIITNQFGVVVKDLSNEVLGGSNVMNVSASEFGAGTFYIQVGNGQVSDSKVFQIMR